MCLTVDAALASLLITVAVDVTLTGLSVDAIDTDGPSNILPYQNHTNSTLQKSTSNHPSSNHITLSSSVDTYFTVMSSGSNLECSESQLSRTHGDTNTTVTVTEDLSGSGTDSLVATLILVAFLLPVMTALTVHLQYVNYRGPSDRPALHQPTAIATAG